MRFFAYAGIGRSLSRSGNSPPDLSSSWALPTGLNEHWYPPVTCTAASRRRWSETWLAVWGSLDAVTDEQTQNDKTNEQIILAIYIAFWGIISDKIEQFYNIQEGVFLQAIWSNKSRVPSQTPQNSRSVENTVQQHKDLSTHIFHYRYHYGRMSI